MIENFNEVMFSTALTIVNNNNTEQSKKKKKYDNTAGSASMLDEWGKLYLDMEEMFRTDLWKATL